MKKSRIGLLVAAALGTLSATSWAQIKVGAKAEASADAAGTNADADATVDADAPAGEAPPATAAPEGEDAGDAGEGVGDICKIDPSACPVLDMKKEAARPIRESIYAVQQIYVLRARRLEVSAWYAQTLNDQFVSHPGPSVALNYYITNVLAIGAGFNYYRPFNSDSSFNGQVRRSARVAVPLNEYDWGASLNFTYVPMYGKFNGFGDFIFEYDAYVVGGVGAISTRPITVIDPDNRNFKYEPKLAFNVGLGVRIFFSRWLALNLAVRDYTFNEQLENLTIHEQNPQQQSRWLGDKSLTWDVEFQAGLSVLVPFSFDYRLPK